MALFFKKSFNNVSYGNLSYKILLFEILSVKHTLNKL
jgi:hypothetical protein